MNGYISSQPLHQIIPSAYNSTYLLRGESAITARFLQKYQNQLDAYEALVDALAELPPYNALVEAIQEQQQYCDALRTAIDAKESELRTLSRRLPTSPKLSNTLKSFNSMGSLSNIFHKTRGTSQSRVSNYNDEDTPRKSEDFQQEMKTLDLARIKQKDADSMLALLQQQLTDRQFQTMQCAQLILELFEGQTPDFPEEDQLERLTAKLNAKVTNLRAMQDSVGAVVADLQEICDRLSNAVEILTELLTNNSRNRDYLSAKFSEYERCVSACEASKDLVLMQLSDLQTDRLNTSRAVDKNEIAKAIETFKVPLISCQSALNGAKSTFHEQNIRLRQLEDDYDRCTMELDRIRRSILVRAIAIRRSRRGVHPLHPELVPSPLRPTAINSHTDENIFNDTISTSSIPSASHDAATKAAMEAQIRIREINFKHHRSKLSIMNNAVYIQNTDVLDEEVSSTHELSSSVWSEMEREHDEYQAAEAIYLSPHNNFQSSLTRQGSSRSAKSYKGYSSNRREPGLVRQNSGRREVPGLSRQNSGRRDGGYNLVPQRTNSGRRHLRSISIDARSSRSFAVQSIVSSQWTISTSAAYSIPSPPEKEMHLKNAQNNSIHIRAESQTWTISSGAASPSSYCIGTPPLTHAMTAPTASSVVTVPEYSYADFSSMKPSTSLYYQSSNKRKKGRNSKEPDEIANPASENSHPLPSESPESQITPGHNRRYSFQQYQQFELQNEAPRQIPVTVTENQNFASINISSLRFQQLEYTTTLNHTQYTPYENHNDKNIEEFAELFNSQLNIDPIPDAQTDQEPLSPIKDAKFVEFVIEQSTTEGKISPQKIVEEVQHNQPEVQQISTPKIETLVVNSGAISVVSSSVGTEGTLVSRLSQKSRRGRGSNSPEPFRFKNLVAPLRRLRISKSSSQSSKRRSL
ncbi:hypothetical protein HK098_005214 [Nowakowskiella sp. JEL0407]|nr:hypothetical protein HK098_005214 [Nowakowskiella sp. JEL0407]